METNSKSYVKEKERMVKAIEHNREARRLDNEYYERKRLED
jgi:hypothetical protein